MVEIEGREYKCSHLFGGGPKMDKKNNLANRTSRQARRNYMGQLQCFIYDESYLDQFYHQLSRCSILVYIQERSEEFHITVFQNLITIVISYALFRPIL